MTTQELIDYYKSLLIIQYASKPNALATVEAVIRALVQDQIISQVRDGFDIDTAIGAQLDILAAYRGAGRKVFGVTPASYWSLVPADDPNPNSYLGWVESGDPDPTWNWMKYEDAEAVLYSLTDEQLRRLIKLRAKMHSWNGALADLDNILYSFFSSYVSLVDNLNMTITYNHSHTDPDPDHLWDIAVLTDSLPHPSGVAFSVVEV